MVRGQHSADLRPPQAEFRQLPIIMIFRPVLLSLAFTALVLVFAKRSFKREAASPQRCHSTPWSPETSEGLRRRYPSQLRSNRHAPRRPCHDAPKSGRSGPAIPLPESEPGRPGKQLSVVEYPFPDPRRQDPSCNLGLAPRARCSLSEDPGAPSIGGSRRGRRLAGGGGLHIHRRPTYGRRN